MLVGRTKSVQYYYILSTKALCYLLKLSLLNYPANVFFFFAILPKLSFLLLISNLYIVVGFFFGFFILFFLQELASNAAQTAGAASLSFKEKIRKKMQAQIKKQCKCALLRTVPAKYGQTLEIYYLNLNADKT